jgi:hypothetical protein
MTLSFERKDTKPRYLLRAGLRLLVEIPRLKEDRKFKKKVLDELAAVADKGHVNLTPLVREYVEKLCEVHESMRGWISADVASWDQTIILVLDRSTQRSKTSAVEAPHGPRDLLGVPPQCPAHQKVQSGLAGSAPPGWAAWAFLP